MNHRCDILVITPPRRATIWNVIAGTHPPRTQGIDSVPLRLAAVLEQQYAVAFLPLYHLLYNYYQLDARLVMEYLQRYNPRTVIIANDYFISNRSTACFPAALKIAGLCKEVLPDVLVVMTGKHVIARPLDPFQVPTPATDLVITVEPEDFICDVISRLLSGRSKSLQSFPGVVDIACGTPPGSWRIWMQRPQL